MKAARVEKIISAIDIGSSKVSALIAGQTDTGDFHTKLGKDRSGAHQSQSGKARSAV